MTRQRAGRLILGASGLLTLLSLVMYVTGLAQGRPRASAEWRAYGGTLASTKYSPLDQINARNARQLRIAWRQSATPVQVRQGPGAPVPINYAHTPLMVGGLLYMSTGYGTVAALDASTGKVVWFDPPPPRAAITDGPAIVPVAGLAQAKRGLAYWTDGRDERIITTVGRDLVALNAKTGKRYPGFGSGGAVDLTKGYEFDADVTAFTWSAQPIVVRDVIVVGGHPATRDGRTPPGDIRGFDVRTGTQLWTFHVVPRPGEFGADSYLNDSLSRAGRGGTWSMMSADEELGYVYAPLKSVGAQAGGEYYNGEIPGNNLFGESIVCLDARTGKRIWHYQIVHHGVWDWDLPAAPTLVDIRVNGRAIKAVAQVTKHGFTFVFDRITGQPVWPIEERPVPAGDVPGEWYSPTQPYPTKPPAYEEQDATIDDLVDFTPALRAEAIAIISQYRYGHLFLAPSIIDPAPGGTRGTLNRIGTAPTTWNGAAFDPETGTLYVPSVHMTGVLALTKPTSPAERRDWVVDPNGPFYGYQLAGPQGLPDPFKPPYGRVTALDLNRGERVWSVANGDGPRDHPALRHLKLGRLGQQGRAAPLVTRTLLFIGEGGREGVAGLPPQGGGKMFRAYDKKTGDVVWEMELPGGTTGAPMTYMVDGRQYVVVAVGWKDSPGELIALALP
jgi:quinoprotein glucose dehydrogenase